MARRFFLVSYDISDDKRRNNVARVLLDFGDRLQYSVFCCQLNPRERVSLKRRLEPCLNHQVDQVLFLEAGPVKGTKPVSKIKTVGKAIQTFGRSHII